MPPTIQWYVRTAMVYIAAAMLLAVLYQLDQVTHWFHYSPYLIVVHAHLALVGGVIQMIMGVGLWMFPLTVPIDQRLQYREGLAWLTFLLFNGGLLGRFVADWEFRVTGSSLWGFVSVLTGLMQFAAFAIFLYHAWSLRLAKRTQHGA